MNILGHTAIGITGYLITGSEFFLIGSLIPDISLIGNELKFKKFDKWNVRGKVFYDITHSLYFPFLLFFINWNLFLGVLIHILVDIPFHSSSFRWKPFLINRYKPVKKALLLSGGMDSVACALLEKDFDCIYFNYGQEYHYLEHPMAEEMAKKLGKELIVINKNWKTDIQNRNYYLISEVKKLGYNEVIIGTRNIIPLFDKYKDSNWLNLKIYQYLMGIYINMPLIGQFKWQIQKKLNGYNKYYSTEKYVSINKNI
jgi:hypothetical protein